MSEERRTCQAPKCGRVIVYKTKRFAWVHQSKLPPGDEHAPVVTSAPLRDTHVAHEEGDARTRW